MHILWVFAWLVVGGEETEVRLLATHLPRDRYRLTVIPCFRNPLMPAQTHDQLRQLGVTVDTTPYELSYEDTIAYLARWIERERPDVIVASQGVPDIHLALDLVASPPPLIEHGGIVREVTMTLKHHTTYYVGVCRTIRDAAALLLPPERALEIPSMVDPAEFDPRQRQLVRQELGVDDDTLLVGWVGRLDPKKRVEDFIALATLLAPREPRARFVIIGGPDAFFPEYAAQLRAEVTAGGLDDRVRFLGDRADVVRLLSGLDLLVWLACGEGMPHVISEAGLAALPVVATRDNGTIEQIEDGVSGVFVPYHDPVTAATVVYNLLADASERQRLGQALAASVRQQFSVEVVVPQWQALFEHLLDAP
ncbi:MAG: glycosyltransferase family 4 protein [Herpetosiphonaceae bacterium]|nr:glycosyltransferase family 4 protein [Herpetosiphonaceae bacterium]